MKSDLPLGAGLGSSAAFCVSISGALLAAAGTVRAQAGDAGTECGSFDKADLELISQKHTSYHVFQNYNKGNLK